MKYTNEYTGEVFETAKDCVASEKAFVEKRDKEKEAKEKKAAERKARAAEVEDARKAMVTAQHKYSELLEAFIKTYGSYHYSSHSVEDIPLLFQPLLDFFK